MRALLLTFLLLCSPVLAANDFTIQDENILAFFNSSQEIVIVQGEYTSTAELSLLKLAQDRYPEVAEIQVISEGNIAQEDLVNKSPIYLGGPTQNTFAAHVFQEDAEFETHSYTVGSITYITGEKKYVVLSDYKGFSNLPRTATKKSPLAKIMPEAFVPATATVLGLFLIWAVKFIPLVLKVTKLKIANKVMKFVKKREFRHTYKGKKIKGVRLKIREWLAILMSATIFAASVSYMYMSPNIDLALLILSTIIVNFIVYSIRHIVRLVYDKRHELHTEYTIWYWGALITVATSLLGNTFSLAGYIVSDETRVSKKEGKISFVVNLITFIAFAVFWVWNLLTPTIILQMTMLLCLSITFLQMLPLSPFAGKKVYKWRKGVWYVTFIPLAVVYILVNLV